MLLDQHGPQTLLLQRVHAQSLRGLAEHRRRIDFVLSQRLLVYGPYGKLVVLSVLSRRKVRMSVAEVGSSDILFGRVHHSALHARTRTFLMRIKLFVVVLVGTSLSQLFLLQINLLACLRPLNSDLRSIIVKLGLQICFQVLFPQRNQQAVS